MTRLKNMHRLVGGACAAATLALSGMPAQAGAQNIVDAWKSVAVPPPPPLQAVAVDRAHTALLVLDMNAASCTDAVKPSCFRSIPAVQRLLKDARAHDMLVVFSTGPASSGPAPKTPDALTPLAGEQIVRAGADKFVGSDLEKILAARDIRSIIVTGTSAEGAVLYTASAAALRKMKAIVPVDAYSSANPFAELYTAWHLKNAPSTISSNVTVTKTDMITIE